MEKSFEQPVTECILDDGAWQFQGYDENGLCRSLNGRPTGVHTKVVLKKSRAQDDKSIWI